MSIQEWKPDWETEALKAAFADLRLREFLSTFKANLDAPVVPEGCMSASEVLRRMREGL